MLMFADIIQPGSLRHGSTVSGLSIVLLLDL